MGTETLLAAWTRGWAVSRGTKSPTPFAGGHRVDVGRPDHLVRYVVHLPEHLPGLPGKVAEPGAWIKVPGDPARLADLFPEPWQVQPPEFFMTGPLRRADPVAPGGYALRRTRLGDVLVVEAVSGEGEIAATGRMGLLPADGHGVADQISTSPGHRRKGLGSLVMTALADEAAANGVTTGLLLATPDGRALYESLGWTFRTLVTAATVPTGSASDTGRSGP